MTFAAAGVLGSASSRVAPRSPRPEDYDSSSSTDSGEIARTSSHPRPRATFTAPNSSLDPDYLFPPPALSGRTSLTSTAASSPIPSRSGSPFRQFFSSHPSSSCTSDTDSESNSPLLRTRIWREDRRRWWMMGSTTRRRRRRVGIFMRTLKKWTRRIFRHPFFPRQPITIVLTLLLLSVFAVFLTLLLIYILNPDKESLPWRAYCTVPSSTAPPDYSSSSPSIYDPILSASGRMLPPFPPVNLESLSPAGVFVGVFSVDSAFERRMLVRTTWASHPRSRKGASESDGGMGTSRTIVRFILGQPRKEWERRIQLEMQMYNDIVILPVAENMNSGKTYSFFSWASLHAWVPPVYLTSLSVPQFSYSNSTSRPPPLAPHDSPHARTDQNTGRPKRWLRPDFVVKVDDDSFVMLAELEARLRLELHLKPPVYPESPYSSSILGGREQISLSSANASADTSNTEDAWSPLSSKFLQDPLVYWGYLVKNRFMAGELYGLSWNLVDWVANDPSLKGLTKGAEDKQTAKWMRLHPRAADIRWTSERCWIYDHPRSGTVYSHGFLFPSEVTRIRRNIMSYLDKASQDVLSGPATSLSPTPSRWAYSSVSTFGVRYSPPLPDLTPLQSVEALVEGSDMSKIREGNPMTAEYAWKHREGRAKRYDEKRVGGTVVVHFIKKNMWFLETALALLEGEERTESERFHQRDSEVTITIDTSRAVKRSTTQHRVP